MSNQLFSNINNNFMMFSVFKTYKKSSKYFRHTLRNDDFLDQSA